MNISDTTFNTVHTFYDGDIPVAHAQVEIYPMYDEAFEDAIAADYRVENPITLKYHTVSDAFGKAIAAQMKDERPDEWQELFELAEANFRMDEDAA